MKLNLLFIFAASSFFVFLVLDMLVRYLQETLELHKNPKYEELRRFIEPKRLLMARIFGGMLAASAAFIIQLACGVRRMSIGVPVAMFFGLVAWHMVFKYYRFKLEKRKHAFEDKILDFAMGLQNAVKSGLSVGQAVESISRRIGGPMQEELQILLQETRLNVDLSDAFEHLYERMPFEDMHILSTAVALSMRSGGSLGDVLEEIVGVIRARKEFYGKLDNMTAQGRFEALMISCAPLAIFVLLYAIDPVMMEPLVTSHMGWLAVGCSALLLFIGYKVLKRLITIEV